MKLLSVSVLLVVAVTGCSSAPSTPTGGDTVSTSPAGTNTSAAASQTPTLSTSSGSSATPTPTETSVESLGEDMGAKIAFYAVAKAAGMDDTAKMDALASGICSRIESGKPGDVGPWMKDTFQLEGDVAAKVAVTAIEVSCPKFKSMFGS